LPKLPLGFDKFHVIEGIKEYSDAREMLFKHLMRLPKDRFYRRILRNAEIKSLEDWETRAAEIREAFLEAIGGLPDEKTPLNARTVGVVEREDYFVEKVIFESLPDFHVTANLYIPKNRKGKVPGILFPIGHWYSGKSSSTNHYAAVGLVKRGYVVLLYDTIGQGERYQVLNPHAKVYSGLPFDPAVSLVGVTPTREHDMVGIQCFLAGINLARFVVWDGIRALDYLVSRPEVDGERIGCTGCSGGGTYTTYLTALDDRIKVAVPVCAVNSVALGFNSDESSDAEQVFMNAIPNLLDHGDLLMMAFPRPVLIIREAKDYVRLGTRVAYYEAKTLYERLGYGDRIQLLEVDAPHGYFKEMREPMYFWMDKWLKGVEKEEKEPEIHPIDARDLICTKTGQVLIEFNGRTVRDLVEEYLSRVKPEKKIPRNDAELERFRANLIKKVTDMLHIKRHAQDVEVRKMSEFIFEGHLVEKLLLYTEPGIYVPALFFKSSGPRGDHAPAVLYVNTMGKAVDAYQNGPILSLLDKGFNVLSIDVRGTGETEPTRLNERDKMGGYTAFLQGFKSVLSYKSLLLGRSIFGMQLIDVLRSFEYLTRRKEIRKNQIWILGRHLGGMLALHAGLLEDKVYGVVASDFLISYRSIIRNPVYSWHIMELIPGVLAHYDLDEIAASIAPNKLLLTNILDHQKKPVKLDEAEEAYSLARQVYNIMGFPEYFRLAEPTCDEMLPKIWLPFMT